MKKLRSCLIFIVLAFHASAKGAEKPYKYNWINDVNNGEPIIITESDAFLVRVGLNTRQDEHIYFFTDKSKDSFCKEHGSTVESVNSIKFNSVLVKMTHACTSGGDHYYYPTTDNGSTYIIEQLKKTKLVYLTDSITGNTFDKISSKNFSLTLNRYRNSRNNATGGL